MLTLLEGPDGAGKTHLARQLAARYAPATVTHMGPPSARGAFHDMVDQLTRRRRTKRVIFDRAHLGERVYGPVHRGVDTLGPIRQRLLERVMLARRAVLVLCLPPLRECVATFMIRKDQEMLDDAGQLAAVHAEYARVEATSHLPVVRYDYTRTSFEALCAAIDAVRPSHNFGPGVGAFEKGNILIVGEQVNGRARFPFTDDQGCAPWITQRLEQAGIREDRLYWVNALDPEGEWTDPGFVDGLEPRRIVALGKVAAAWCKDAGLACETVTHPQHHKRFFYHRPYPLLEILRDAA